MKVSFTRHPCLPQHQEGQTIPRVAVALGVHKYLGQGQFKRRPNLWGVNNVSQSVGQATPLYRYSNSHGCGNLWLCHFYEEEM